MGLFDVNMPMLYGEGKAKAFLRLQRKIMKLWCDESLFFWRWNTASGLLNYDLDAFCCVDPCPTCDAPEFPIVLFGLPKRIDYSTTRVRRSTNNLIRQPPVLTSEGLFINVRLFRFLDRGPPPRHPNESNQDYLAFFDTLCHLSKDTVYYICIPLRGHRYYTNLFFTKTPRYTARSLDGGIELKGATVLDSTMYRRTYEAAQEARIVMDQSRTFGLE